MAMIGKSKGGLSSKTYLPNFTFVLLSLHQNLNAGKSRVEVQTLTFPKLTFGSS